MPSELWVTKNPEESPLPNHWSINALRPVPTSMFPKEPSCRRRNHYTGNEYSSELGEQHLSEGREQAHFLAVDQIVELHCQHT